jgi:hypothetical protein
MRRKGGKVKYPILTTVGLVGACAPRRAITSMLLAAALVLGSIGHGVANDGTIRVMARNLYQGANFDALVAATTFPELLAAAGQAVLDIRASKPAERAAAVAREIVRNRVDLVGLQEAVILRTGPLSLPPDPAAALPETSIESDGLQLLLAALQRLGEPYHVVAIVPGLDAQLPTGLGIDARLTVRIAIIARSRGSDLKLSNVQVQGFLRNLSFPTLGGQS